MVFSTLLGKGEVHLLNDMGQEFAAPTTELDGRAQIDVSALPAGTYLVIVVAERDVLKKRLVVAR